jgi:hypothetical protein
LGSGTEEKSQSCSRKMVSLAVLSLAIGHFLGPAFYHDIKAQRQGMKHLGFGIYLDTAKIETLLTAEERKLLKSPPAHEAEIAALFTRKLSGDSSKDMSFLSLARDVFTWAKERDASTFFEGQSKSRGICKDKSVILCELLRAFGIRAEIQMIKSPGGLVYVHEWVYLPDLDRYADPSLDRIKSPDPVLIDRKDFEKILKRAGLELSNAKKLDDLVFYKFLVWIARGHPL